MKDYVCAAVTGVQWYDHVFRFKLVGDTLHVRYMDEPYVEAGKADTQDIVELAKKYLKKWCGRKKIRGITIFEPQVAAEVEESEDANEQ